MTAAAQKADVFQSMASQITKLSSGIWTAARRVETEGSHVFLGGVGGALVIYSSGELFRGSLQFALHSTELRNEVGSSIDLVSAGAAVGALLGGSVGAARQYISTAVDEAGENRPFA